MQQANDTTKPDADQRWAKVPVRLLSAGLSSVELRTMIALLSFADPRRPGKEIWAKLRTIARMIGLADSRAGDNTVSRVVKSLGGRGFVENRTAPGRGLRLSLKPFLAGIPSRESRETPSRESREAQGPTLTRIAGGPSRESHSTTEQTTEQTKRHEQTRQTDHADAPVSSVSPVASVSQGNGRNGNGQQLGPTHTERSRPEMREL